MYCAAAHCTYSAADGYNLTTYLLILTDSTSRRHYDAPCSMILMLMLMLLYTVLTSNAQFCLNFLLLSVFKARSNYNNLS